MSPPAQPGLTRSPAVKLITEVLLPPGACVFALLITGMVGGPAPTLWTVRAPGSVLRGLWTPKRVSWLQGPSPRRIWAPRPAGTSARSHPLQETSPCPHPLSPVPAHSLLRGSSEKRKWRVQKSRHAPGERAWLWDQSAWSAFNKHQGLSGFFLCMQIWLQQTLLGKVGRQLALGRSLVTQKPKL